ncbi:class I SAM-dependent methyltransferase [Shimia abyssi]|uniref:Methyltransferase family protein n=1 Tax=Shimia abyssi TaxID=1662395 RepID=A0A2P8FA20_9RHOB|nr:class I SAM-dependent methyltransferase [Shimia abyssi]PSL18512.1 methyltransferase family protein [Shimia abyssi]
MTRDYLTTNKDVWNADAANWVDFAKDRWVLDPPQWGTWGNTEEQLSMLPVDMAGMDAIELGCGTGYVSYWMSRRGARVTGIDISTEQLQTARNLATQHGSDIAFVEGNAEETGLPDGSFDFAISEYGASIWCPPDSWLPEAWRLLRPGGQLVFLGNHPLSLICSPLDGAPANRTLHRPYKNIWGADWTTVEFEPTGVCFNLTMSGWMDLFSQIGFLVTRYQELYAPEWAQGTRAAIPSDWAKEYPVEQVFHLRKPN